MKSEAKIKGKTSTCSCCGKYWINPIFFILFDNTWFINPNKMWCVWYRLFCQHVFGALLFDEHLVILEENIESIDSIYLQVHIKACTNAKIEFFEFTPTTTNLIYCLQFCNFVFEYRWVGEKTVFSTQN